MSKWKKWWIDLKEKFQLIRNLHQEVVRLKVWNRKLIRENESLTKETINLQYGIDCAVRDLQAKDLELRGIHDYYKSIGDENNDLRSIIDRRANV